MVSKDYLKTTGSILMGGGLIGGIASLASAFLTPEYVTPGLGISAGTCWSGWFIQEYTKSKKRTLGDYLKLAGLAIGAIGFFDIGDTNTGAFVMGTTALVSGSLYSLIEDWRHSKRESSMNLENQLHQ